MKGRALARLPRSALVELANALAAGRLTPPYVEIAVSRHAPEGQASTVAASLEELAAIGMTPPHIAATLRLMAEERESAQRLTDRVELVWTGPEVAGARTRDTLVVVRDLFARAERSVLVSCYAIAGDKVLEPLAERMRERPQLSVRVFANVARPHLDQRPDTEILREFAEKFRHTFWPGGRLPEVLYDPRALAAAAGPRACLHAKAIVVDDLRALVTSANFTEAAQERNIEAGVLVEDRVFAAGLRAQFENLVARGLLVSLPGLPVTREGATS